MTQKYEESFNNKCLFSPPPMKVEMEGPSRWRPESGEWNSERDTNPSDAMQSDTAWALRCIDFEAGSRNKQGSVRAGTQTPAKYVPVPRSNIPHVCSYQIRTWQYVHVPRNNTHGSHFHASHYHSVSSI